MTKYLLNIYIGSTQFIEGVDGGIVHLSVAYYQESKEKQLIEYCLVTKA